VDYRVVTATTAEILPLNRKSSGLSEASAFKRKDSAFISLASLCQSPAITGLPKRSLLPTSSFVDIALDELAERRHFANAEYDSMSLQRVMGTPSRNVDPFAHIFHSQLPPASKR